jgi:hypothetical protein
MDPLPSDQRITGLPVLEPEVTAPRPRPADAHTHASGCEARAPPRRGAALVPDRDETITMHTTPTVRC